MAHLGLKEQDNEGTGAFNYKLRNTKGYYSNKHKKSKGRGFLRTLREEGPDVHELWNSEL